MKTKFLLAIVLEVGISQGYCAGPPPLPYPFPLKDGSILEWGLDRNTQKGSSVHVDRLKNNFLGCPERLYMLLEVEQQLARDYPESSLRVSCAAFNYERNCHDFAWGTYMTIYNNPFSYPSEYEEAWVMDDPSANWTDGSFNTWAVATRVYTWAPGVMMTSGNPLKDPYEFVLGPCGSGLPSLCFPEHARGSYLFAGFAQVLPSRLQASLQKADTFILP